MRAAHIKCIMECTTWKSRRRRTNMSFFAHSLWLTKHTHTHTYWHRVGAGNNVIQRNFFLGVPYRQRRHCLSPSLPLSKCWPCCGCASVCVCVCVWWSWWGECVKCFASICRFMFATWKCCHIHTHTYIVLLHCEWSVNRMSTLYLTRLNESGSGSTAIYLNGTNSDVMRCRRRRRRVMSLSDSAARTQRKARVDRERESGRVRERSRGDDCVSI